MLLSDVLSWIKTKFPCSSYYAGRADTNKDEYLALYNMPADFSGIAVGSSSLTSYSVKVVKFILRYGKNSDTAEKKARDLYNLFLPTFDGSILRIGEHRVISFSMSTAEPQPLGTDDRGNFEYSLDVTINYER